jgi:hypothetical protein
MAIIKPQQEPPGGGSYDSPPVTTQPPITSPPGNGNGKKKRKPKMGCNSCTHESWQCQNGLTEVQVDSNGCPLNQMFCKTQVGAQAVDALGSAVIPAASAFTITLSVPNFTEARVKGLVLAGCDPSGAVLSDFLDCLEISSIQIQGTEELGGGVVTGARYRSDSTGSNCGSGQSYRGRLGTTGGNMVITGINQSASAIRINATADINAVRG